jgi:hypothetical protein
MAIIPALILEILIFADDYYSYKRLWEPLLVYEQGRGRLTDYAWGFRIVFKATRPVKYLTSYYGYKLTRKIPRRV